jgi:hypothetical protein
MKKPKDEVYYHKESKRLRAEVLLQVESLKANPVRCTIDNLVGQRNGSYLHEAQSQRFLNYRVYGRDDGLEHMYHQAPKGRPEYRQGYNPCYKQ